MRLKNPVTVPTTASTWVLPKPLLPLPGATSPLTLEMELDRLCDLFRASSFLFALLEGTASSEILRKLILERTG